MKIFYSASSPFVRKVMVVAHELGVADRIERLPSAVHPIRADTGVLRYNPLGQVPTFFTDDGEVLYDSRVICEYLDASHGDGRIFPAAGAARWRALREQALADGIIAAGILIRYELTVREAAGQHADWIAGQRRKIEDGVRTIEADASALASRVDIGAISLACALSYLDFRLPEIAWRQASPQSAQWLDAFVESRPSLLRTKPSLQR